MGATSFATAVYTALPYFLQLEAEHLKGKDHAEYKQETFRQETFDFIVVGGGTAGCVLANRLSSHFSVLLLEAGGDPPSAVSVPAFAVAVTTSPSINYLYEGIPQKRLQNRKLSLHMGKMLGGSGSHNAIVHNRGNPRDYDNWAQIINDTSWRYDELLKYFKRLENYVGIWPLNGQHGRHGPMQVETEGSLFQSAWKAAAKELGYKYGDPNGPQQIEFSPIDITRKQGRRVSTYTGYLQPIIQRKNLSVMRYADVQEILISEGRVIGVRYLRHGHKFKAFASKETILSAGVFGTPLLLFKSGIGPAGMLRRAGIKVTLNLPAVGMYLQDHVGSLTLLFTPNARYNKALKSPLTEAEFKKFVRFRKNRHLSYTGQGPLALIVSTVAKANNESDWPDIFIAQTYCHPNASTNHICFGVASQRPEFRRAVIGNLKLDTRAYRMRERNNVKLALINHKALESGQNRRIIREGLIFAGEILRTRAMRRVGKQKAGDEVCAARFRVNSIRYWNCYTSRTAISFYHPVGTCRMGPDRDRKHSVVDSKLRVHGIKGLRIADASIMPRLTNTNTNTPVIVVAEKTADVIIRDNMISVTSALHS